MQQEQRGLLVHGVPYNNTLLVLFKGRPKVKLLLSTKTKNEECPEFGAALHTVSRLLQLDVSWDKPSWESLV